MKKSALTEEQITYALRQGERGTPGSAVCRQLGVSAQTCSRGKRKCAGMGMAAWRRLRPLEEEHRTRKHLVADLTVDKPRLQEVLRTKLESQPSAGSWCTVCRWAAPCVSGGRVA